MPDKNSIKGAIVEPQINEKKLERVPKSQARSQNQKDVRQDDSKLKASVTTFSR
jgi:hypothetical protein